MDPETLAKITGGEWENLSGEISITKASVDSRLVEPGDLFVAIKTDKADGHDYVMSAAHQGAVGALVSRPISGVPSLVVSDPLVALQKWARAQREAFSGTVIGIVGSVGKTSAKNVMHHLLQSQYPAHASPKSFNNYLGVPLTLIATPPDTRYLVVEMGANGPGELDALGSLVTPDHLFVTPIGEAHLKGFGSLEGVRRAKGEVLKHVNPEGWLVWPRDPELQAAWHWEGKALTWGDQEADCVPYPCRLEFPQTVIDLPDHSVTFNFPALWLGALMSAMESFLEKIGVTLQWEALETFENDPGRLQILQVNDITLINDAWNANPMSVVHGLNMLSQVSGRRVFVLGDMREMGERSSFWHQEIGRLCNQVAEVLICIGEESQEAVEEFSGEKHVFLTSEDCEKQLSSLVKKGDVVLFKGSRALALDNLASRFVPRRGLA